MFRKAGVMAFAMIAVAVSGCSDGKQASKKNFAGAIERWISENKDKAALCLGLDSGRERGSQDALVLDQQSSDDKKALDAMDVLAANGLLRREEKTEKSWFEVRRLAMFTPTEKGRALILSRTKNQPGLGNLRYVRCASGDSNWLMWRTIPSLRIPMACVSRTCMRASAMPIFPRGSRMRGSWRIGRMPSVQPRATSSRPSPWF